jgi:hypothetical protein
LTLVNTAIAKLEAEHETDRLDVPRPAGSPRPVGSSTTLFVNVGFAFGAVHADGLAAAVIVALDVFVIVGGLLRLHGAGPDPYAELGS